jgi:hypothetical protein
MQIKQEAILVPQTIYLIVSEKIAAIKKRTSIVISAASINSPLMEKTMQTLWRM